MERGKKTMENKLIITKEQALTYFKTKAPKDLRDQDINCIQMFRVKLPKKETIETVWIINERYLIHYIQPEPYNCFMRNQNFKPVIKGCRLTKDRYRDLVDYFELYLY